MKKSGLILVLVAAFLFSLSIGRYIIPIRQIGSTIFSHYFNGVNDANMETVIFNIRLPRIFAGILVGAALSTAGASFQGMFKNPLVSPDMLGASAGAGFGACLAILLSQSALVIQIMAFTFGITAVLIAYFVNVMLDYEPTISLVLGGILVSTLFSSGTGAIKYFADANDKLPAITYWLMGSLSSVTNSDILMVSVPIVIGFVSLFLVRWKLNVLAFGEEEARTLGIDTRKLRFIVIISSTLITSASVSICGMVGWIGLVIPHLARAVVGPDYRKLLPVTFIFGSTFLLLIDDMARCLGAVEIPLGILTSLMGVPFFILIFKQNVRGWK
ncbi:MAG: iron ABC transporter permease [Clostridiaceae bacterium]